jgi:TRAP-type C4-dicarboxylate transport system substrate-binding protein
MKSFFLVPLAILLTIVLILVGCTEPAPATAPLQPVELKFVYLLPQLMTAKYTWEAWGHDIEDATNGLVKINFIDGGEMGDPSGNYDLLVSGKADIVCFYPEYSSEVFPLTSSCTLPLMFPSAEIAAGTLWQFHKKYTADTELKDIKLLAVNPNTPCQLLTNQVHVKALEDLKGLKIASFSPIETKVVEHLGATPVSMTVQEAITYLMQEQADGIAFPWKIAVTLNGMGFTKYRTATDLYLDATLVGMNRDSWNRLSPDIQNIITGATGLLWSRHLGMVSDREANANLLALQEYDKNAGNPDIYWLPEEERQRWVEAVTPIWDEWVQETEGKGLPGKAALDDLQTWVAQYQEMSAPKETTPHSGVSNWEEAYDHVGETWTVTGPIIDSVDLRVYNMGDMIVLGMGKTVSNRSDGVGIHLDVDDAVLPEDLYIDKTISVTGEISLNPLGGASMTVTDMSQIQVVE